MPYTPFLIFGLVAIVVIVLIGIGIRYDRKTSQGRMDLAAMRGWSYTPGGPGRTRFSLEGSCEGGPWKVVVRHGGKNNPGHSAFTCAGVPAPGGVVFVGPAGLGAFLKSGMGRTLSHWGLHLGSMFGADTAILERLLENPIPMDSDGTAFYERFSVLTTDPSLANKLLTQQSKEALLAWEGMGRRGTQRSRGLQLSWSEEGLSLHWPVDHQQPEDMASFAELGMTLVRETRGGGW